MHSNSLFVFDVVQNIWTRKQGMHLARSLFGFGVVSGGDLLVVVGGSAGSQGLGGLVTENEFYDVRRDAWQGMRPLVEQGVEALFVASLE